jgi:hypothetical protein
MEAASWPFERGQLVEIEGLEEEGFPASFVQGIVLQAVKGGLIVEYLEFLDEVTGKQLIEYQPLSRFRPFLPAAARFTSWEDIQVGLGPHQHCCCSRHMPAAHRNFVFSTQACAGTCLPESTLLSVCLTEGDSP